MSTLAIPPSLRLLSAAILRSLSIASRTMINPNQCPGCIGDERLTYGERTFQYCRPTKRNDHFDDHHLEAIERAEQHGEPIVCHECKDVKLDTVDHFRNHVQSVHGITLRTADKAQHRRAQKLKSKLSKLS